MAELRCWDDESGCNCANGYPTETADAPTLTALLDELDRLRAMASEENTDE